MRTIHKTVFMGGGCSGCTSKQILDVQNRLNEAFVALSGLQQCGIGPDTASKEEFADAKAELTDAVTDIAAAFGFKTMGDAPERRKS